MSNNQILERAENGVAARHITLTFESGADSARPGIAPVKEFAADGPDASGRDSERFTGMPDMPGQHVLFLLVRKEDRTTPVLEIDQNGRTSSALPVFTRRESAVLYLQVARSDDYFVESMTPHQVSQLLKAFHRQGIEAVVADPNRRHQEDGRRAGPVIPLKDLGYDSSGENIYQEIHDRVFHDVHE
jgi:hypothetical protein